MRFAPKTEAEIAAASLLPAGVYDFEVVSGSDEVSKAGNDMIKLGLRVYDHQGTPNGILFDYLMEKVAYKLRHASAACGLLDAYETGVLEGSDFVGKSGKVKLRIQKDEQYGDKNQVADYVVDKDTRPVSSGAVRKPATVAADLDDDIPF
jgi:hypothetical protein